jgi:hypothetical protein
MGISHETTRVANGDVQPGDMVPGKGMLIGEFDLVDAYGRHLDLGVKSRWYDTGIELGKPMTFNDTVDAVANCDVNCRGGLRLDPECYEAELFEKLKSGEALGKNVIAPEEVVKAGEELRNDGAHKGMSKIDMRDELKELAVVTDLADWQFTGSPSLLRRDTVRVIGFKGKHVGSSNRESSLARSRVYFAELSL